MNIIENIVNLTIDSYRFKLKFVKERKKVQQQHIYCIWTDDAFGVP